MAALVAAITTLVDQTQVLEAGLADRFEHHPDAEIIRSLPGLGMTLGARVLGEFGGRPEPLCQPQVSQELLRHVTHHPSIRQTPGRPGPLRPQPAPGRRLLQWAFATLTAQPRSPGLLRPPNRDTHHQALRALGNRLVASSTAASTTGPTTTNTPPGTTDKPTPNNKPLDTTTRGMSRRSLPGRRLSPGHCEWFAGTRRQ